MLPFQRAASASRMSKLRGASERLASDLAIEQRLLHLADGARHVDVAWAGFHTVEDGAATPHPLEGVQHLHPVLAALVAGVEKEAVGIDNRRRSHVIAVSPEGRAAGRAQ